MCTSALKLLILISAEANLHLHGVGVLALPPLPHLDTSQVPAEADLPGLCLWSS